MAAQALLQRAICFLDERGRAAPAELARHVFGGEAFADMLGSLASERLLFDGSHWRLRPEADEWAILEVLTTGPNPARHRIVEIAGARGGARFHTLISSEKPVPKLLQKLGVPPQPPDGDWPSLAEAADQVRTFLGGATVVGLGYVPELLDELLGPRWPAIDLLRLVQYNGFSGRPDHVRLARHFGLTPPLGRRPPALLTFSAELFERLRDGRPLAELRELARPRAWSAPEAPKLPSRPGVYVMAESDGRPLYVGKSVDLRRRVSSYLRTPIALTRNMHDLMQLTDRIEVIPVDSELEALLLEGQLIRDWLPPFNVQVQTRERRRYLRLSVGETFPRLTVSANPMADGALYFGPFRHATAAAHVRDLLQDVLRLRSCTRRLPAARKPGWPCAKAAAGTCLAPCIPGPPPAPYGTEVELAKRLLSASPEEFRRTLRAILRERPPAPERARKLKQRVRALAGQTR